MITITKQKLIGMEAEIDAAAVMIGDFNTPPSVTDNR